MFERESPDRLTADRPAFALPRGRTPPSAERARAGINEVWPDQANRQMADLQAQMADMAATLSTSVKTLAQSLELKQANQFFEMQRFQTSVSDKLKEIQKATHSTMDPSEVVVKPKARKKVKGPLQSSSRLRWADNPVSTRRGPRQKRSLTVTHTRRFRPSSWKRQRCSTLA